MTLCGVPTPCLPSSLSYSLHSAPSSFKDLKCQAEELGLSPKPVGKSWKSWKGFKPWDAVLSVIKVPLGLY